MYAFICIGLAHLHRTSFSALKLFFNPVKCMFSLHLVQSKPRQGIFFPFLFLIFRIVLWTVLWAGPINCIQMIFLFFFPPNTNWLKKRKANTQNCSFSWTHHSIVTQFGGHDKWSCFCFLLHLAAQVQHLKFAVRVDKVLIDKKERFITTQFVIQVFVLFKSCMSKKSYLLPRHRVLHIL